MTTERAQDADDEPLHDQVRRSWWAPGCTAEEAAAIRREAQAWVAELPPITDEMRARLAPLLRSRSEPARRAGTASPRGAQEQVVAPEHFSMITGTLETESGARVTVAITGPGEVTVRTYATTTVALTSDEADSLGDAIKVSAELARGRLGDSARQR